ncbi:Txe/YoeB family addiction module toxin [Desulfolutivibrio sulfoxidireducens]|uniref:Txe/YoeB family addiction module toxin n=1 Tax=Desulfolutivibrio sulfoxidireducens TaxID=2773299 RepID=UPI00159DB23A|nr:Txe/YoeB family addiction module toxin [Desulfolutivibrio sulfoxidireducens]QLA18831.1 Txe/YoeB family addiction module toxin [Desulfolutivibrio sulfoxidireducens]
MRLVWTPQAWEDYLFWQATDRSKVKRINELIRETLRSPFEGKGKPEALRFDLSGYWSRRITAEHRLIYGVSGDDLVIVACRYHYS